MEDEFQSRNMVRFFFPEHPVRCFVNLSGNVFDLKNDCLTLTKSECIFSNLYCRRNQWDMTH